MNKIYHRNSAAYVINRNFLLKQKKLIGIKTEGHVIRKQQISIDNYEDLIKSTKSFSKIKNYFFSKTMWYIPLSISSALALG